MRKHRHQGHPAPHEPTPREPRQRARSHPLTLVFGLLLVAALIGATAFAARSLYLDYTWRSTAQSSAEAVARAIVSYGERDDSTPEPVDAVVTGPTAGQVELSDLPYSSDLPAGLTRVRVGDGGALSVLTASGALCSGVTLSMSTPGGKPAGGFECGEALVPTAPAALRVTPNDASVDLEWARSTVPIEDYAVSYSPNDGATWVDVADGVSATPLVTVRNLINGHDYLFRVGAVNLVGQSPVATTRAAPFTSPAAPTGVRAVGGFSAIVTWTPPLDDGGRPVTGFVVSGDPVGTCRAPATATRCVFTDLPGAPDYTFTVRAINAAGPGTPSRPSPDPVAVFSVPGPPVALNAVPGDRIALLTWTVPLRDGNTPIVDYRVDYRAVGATEWIAYGHPESTDTAITIGNLVNGTPYEFQVRAVNAAGVSDPPVQLASTTPATIPDAVTGLTRVAGNESVTLTWQAPASDGESPLTDYAIEFHAAGDPWTAFDHPAGTGLTRDVTGLENGTSYAFRVAAVNAMGTGPWSKRVIGRPVGPPGPVLEPEAVGSLTAIELTWKPPENDGGRPLLGYRVDYKLSASPDWIALPRIPVKRTTATVEDLVAGEAYDFRIVALSRAGVGQSTPDSTDRPTLAGVIADETPPAPKGVSATAGDGQVTLRWRASPAGPDSPITAYTVTGVPAGTCTTKKLSCVVRGLANGRAYTFTVSASNANITGPESRPVNATPQAFNAATGGEVSTVTRGGRTFRVHTFYASAPFVITAGSQPFSVLVVAGGGGSSAAADGSIVVGGGGGILEARRTTLTVGQLNVVVGPGGSPGAPGGLSSIDGFGAANPGAPAAVEVSPVTTSAVSGTPTTYGGAGTPTSGPGIDGRGTGGGGPGPNRGGNGIVIISYEVAR